MKFKVVTAVATEPISLAVARLHLRLDTSGGTHPDDDLIEANITAAREFAEHYTGKALATQTLEMAIDEFPEPEDDRIALPMPPVASITHIKYTDTAGAEQTITSTAYALSLYGEARYVAPTFGNYWPTTQDIPDAVRIRYVTGYTTTPKAVKAAMLLMIAHWYENRQDASVMKLEEIPNGARALLDTVRSYG